MTSSSSISGGVAPKLGDRLSLGQKESQQRHALLALRAVGAKLTTIEAQRQSSSRCGP